MKRGRGQERDKEKGERRGQKEETKGKRRRKGKEGEKNTWVTTDYQGSSRNMYSKTRTPGIQGSGPRVQVSRGNFALCCPYLNPRSSTQFSRSLIVITVFVVRIGFFLVPKLGFLSTPPQICQILNSRNQRVGQRCRIFFFPGKDTFRMEISKKE